MTTQKRGGESNRPGREKNNFRNDFYKYFTLNEVQASGILIVELHRPGFKCFINPEVSGWNIYSQWSFKNHKTP